MVLEHKAVANTANPKKSLYPTRALPPSEPSDATLTAAESSSRALSVHKRVDIVMSGQHYEPLVASQSTSSPPTITSSTLRRWRPFLILAALTTILLALVPHDTYESVSTAAKGLVRFDKGTSTLPTLAVVDTRTLVDDMAKAGRACGWYHGQPHREKTTAPYGIPLETPTDSPYFLTEADQYSLDHIVTTRILSYSNLVPLLSDPQPDFIFVPVLSQLWSNPWGCPDPNLISGISRTTQLLRQLVAQVGPSPYPRIVLAISPIRSQLERDVFTPELMQEFNESVVVVSIENALKTNAEGMKYTIDLPYPTGFHLSLDRNNTRATLDDKLLTRDRPYLLNYAASTTHPWGASALERFNGFALRAALAKEFTEYNARSERTPTSTGPKILYDEITNSMDGAQNLTMFHEHMAQSTFCPMPAGDSPSRRAFFEAVLLGCIPVIFRQHAYGRLLPSSPEINDVTRYTVFVPENDLILEQGPSLIERLRSISTSEIRQKQQHLHSIAAKLQWSIPSQEEWFESDPWVEQSERVIIPQGAQTFNITRTKEREAILPVTQDAFSMLLRELSTIRGGNWKLGQVEDLRPDPLEDLIIDA
ncbi:uncharacterized protein JCM15063_005496 [Sporobolomyces koalae]|uniref:uncharacterized protein n=1 Tax=Sporobolomyces koalae TaxID=500713 RepID=UPI00317B309F